MTVPNLSDEERLIWLIEKFGLRVVNSGPGAYVYKDGGKGRWKLEVADPLSMMRELKFAVEREIQARTGALPS